MPITTYSIQNKPKEIETPKVKTVVTSKRKNNGK